MSDIPTDGTAIAAIVSAGGAALGTVIGAWKGLTDSAALKARVDALEGLGLAALKTTIEALKLWAEGELKKLRTDLDTVAIARLALEKRVEAHATEMRGGKRQPTGTYPAVDPTDAVRALARDEAQEKRLADLEKRAESNTTKIDKMNDTLNVINTALAVIETHLKYVVEEKRSRRGT